MQSITQKLEKANNDWCKALYYVILDFTGGTNMKKVLRQSPLFWKFQSRISDLKKWHPEFKRNLQSIPIPFKDEATGKSGHYNHYTFTGNKAYLLNLYAKINKQGLYRAHKPKDKK